MSKETTEDSLKQAVFSSLQVYAGVEGGTDKAMFLNATSLATGLSESTIVQYLKELSGQVHFKKGRLIVDSGAVLISTTSRAPSTRHQVSDGIIHGRDWSRRGRRR